MMKSYNENSSEINEKAFDLGLEVAHIIHQIGVPAHIKGYQYLRTAIMLVVEDCDIIDSATKRLYPSVARKYVTTTSRVEAAIRKAIDLAWDRGDVDILNSYFGYNRGRPTPTEFIAMIADHLTVKESDDPMLTTVTKILHQFSVPANIKGYNYLRTAILLTVKDSDIIDSATKRLYPSVARKYVTTTSRVEAAIRKAIDLAWDRGDVDILNSYFGYNRGRPTPTEFIAMIADHLTVKESDDPMLTTVTKILHQFSVPANIKGYNYLRTAILLTVKDSDIIDSATKRLYPSVARKYGTTTSCVEGAIRNALNTAWDRGNLDIIISYFGYTKANKRRRPTPTEFIAIIANDLRLKYGKFN